MTELFAIVGKAAYLVDWMAGTLIVGALAIAGIKLRLWWLDRGR